MSTSFSANQYQNAFYSKKLQNWQVPSVYTSNPRSLSGPTQIIATDRGHLMSEVPRSRKNPWGNFIGTWDLPRRIPGHSVQVPTARSTYAQELIQSDQKGANWVIGGGKKNATRRNLDAVYASRNPPVFPGAENPPEQVPYSYHSLSPTDQRSGAAAPATSMFPAIGTVNPDNDYSCTCGSGHDLKPLSPVNRIPTPGFANTPPPMTNRIVSPPVMTPFRASSGLIAL